jgi:Abortive infection alpha
MNDALDPTGGWAKVTEETAKASKEAIQASRELGHFIRGPASELVGMLEDHLKVVRFERLVRLADRVRHFLAERGKDAPTQRLPLNIGLPLLENATLEEDDDLQDIWAKLLVNGGDADSGIELRRAFVSVLAEMSAFDVRNGPICEQDHGSKQPTPVEGAEAGDEPEDPADDREACLHYVAPLVGQLPLGEERPIVELKARGLLGDVDVDCGPRE